MIDGFRTAAANPIGFSFLTEVMRVLDESASDFDVIRDAGIPGLSFAFARGSSIYHTAADDPDELHAGGMAHNGELALGVARHFGGVDIAAADGDSATVFFTVPGYLLVSYPTTWSWVVYLAGLAATVAAIRRHRAADRPDASMGLGIATVAGASLAIAVVVALAWMVIVGLRPSMRTVESYVWAAILLAVVVGAWLATVRVTRRWSGDLISGVLVVWAALGGISVVAAPAVGYLFIWGTLVGGLAVALTASAHVRVEVRMGVLAAVSLTMLVLAVPLADTFFLFAGPRPGNPGSQVPATIAVSGLVAYLVAAIIGIVLTERPDGASVRDPERIPQPTSTTAS
jgi:hypothetical protein